MSEYRSYPTPQTKRSGCKVSWYYYADKADADNCAEAAAHNANLMYREGYDFGYCSPGSIEKVDEGQYAGLYSVCIA